VGSGNRVLDGPALWYHLANMVERLCVAAMSGFATRGGNIVYFQNTLGNLVVINLGFAARYCATSFAAS